MKREQWHVVVKEAGVTPEKSTKDKIKAEVGVPNGPSMGSSFGPRDGQKDDRGWGDEGSCIMPESSRDMVPYVQREENFAQNARRLQDFGCRAA